jgi:hypothetical protein
MIVGNHRTLIIPINALTVGSVALVVATKTVASVPIPLIPNVKIQMVPMVVANVNGILTQRHNFSVRIQVSNTRTLLRENTASPSRQPAIYYVTLVGALSIRSTKPSTICAAPLGRQTFYPSIGKAGSLHQISLLFSPRPNLRHPSATNRPSAKQVFYFSYYY